MTYNLGDYGAGALDHFRNPRNAGEIRNPDAVAVVENPACGDTMKLSLRIRGGVIRDAKFKTFGCGAAIATSSVATTLIRGMRLEEAAKITSQQVADALGGIPPAKRHCSMLAEEAIRAAVKDYRERPSGA